MMTDEPRAAVIITYSLQRLIARAVVIITYSLQRLICYDDYDAK